MRRVEVPAPIAATFARSTANHAVAFALTEPGVERWTPLHWARAVFEDAPAARRWFVVFGWRRVLGLRLGPGHRRATCSVGRSRVATWWRGA